MTLSKMVSYAFSGLTPDLKKTFSLRFVPLKFIIKSTLVTHQPCYVCHGGPLYGSPGDGVEGERGVDVVDAVQNLRVQD